MSKNTTLWIVIENGDVFEGTVRQFEECFFAEPTVVAITEWCGNHGRDARFEWFTDEQMDRHIQDIKKEAIPT